MLSLKCFALEFSKFVPFCGTPDTSHILCFARAQNVIFLSFDTLAADGTSPIRVLGTVYCLFLQNQRTIKTRKMTGLKKQVCRKT